MRSWTEIRARPSGVHHYDSLDELVTGVLGFDEPEDSGIRPEPEKVLYQPTLRASSSTFLKKPG